MGGYVGRYLEVDLARGAINELPIAAEVQRKYLGGSGLAAHLFFQRGKQTADPLGPDNDLFVLTGPISGTLDPGQLAVRRGGALAAHRDLGRGELRRGLRPRAQALRRRRPRLRRPVADAGHARPRRRRRSSSATPPTSGASTPTRRRTASRETMGGKKRPSVLSIGQAGENLVRFACIANNKHDFIGRTGMGAVMGSKRLKAVVCRGEGTIPIADPDGYKAICKELVKKIAQAVPAQALKEMGTDSAMDLGMMIGDIPIANWSRGEDFELSNALSGPTMSETYLKRGLACYACPIACRREVEVPDGPYKTAVGPGPEYETCGSFGTMLDQKDLAGVIKSNEWCNRYGVDSISAGCTIAWAYDCFAKGLLTLEDTGRRRARVRQRRRRHRHAAQDRPARGDRRPPRRGEPRRGPAPRARLGGAHRRDQGARDPDARPPRLARARPRLHDLLPRRLPQGAPRGGHRARPRRLPGRRPRGELRRPDERGEGPDGAHRRGPGRAPERALPSASSRCGATSSTTSSGRSGAVTGWEDYSRRGVPPDRGAPLAPQALPEQPDGGDARRRPPAREDPHAASPTARRPGSSPTRR